MNILSLSREELKEMVANGFLRKENLRHYDICKAMAQGTTQEKAAEIFGVTDDRYIRRIKERKCPECKKI